MSTLKATYQRQLEANGVWLGQEQIELSFDAEQAGDFVLVAFTVETLERLASLGLTTEELVGCEEAAEETFWESEREQCRLASTRQRNATQAA